MKTTRTGYECKHPWPEDCSVQSGDRGVVLRSKEKGGNYGTAFFEAFPRNPNTFIRGEGETVEEAEDQAYQTFLKYQACEHDYERINDDGRGKCRHCGMTNLTALESIHACGECGVVGVLLTHPEDRARKICTECFVGEVGDRILKRPLSSLAKPETKEESEKKGILDRLLGMDEDDPEYDAFLVNQEAQLRAKIRFLKKLLLRQEFRALKERERVKVVEHGDLVAMRMINRPMMRVVELIVKYFPERDTIRFLDEKAYCEIICESEPVLSAMSDYMFASWLNKEIPEAGDEHDLERLHGEHLDRLVNAIYVRLVEWGANPPEDGEQRRRISTPAEFKEGLSGMMTALASGAPKDE